MICLKRISPAVTRQHAFVQPGGTGEHLCLQKRISWQKQTTAAQGEDDSFPFQLHP